MKFKLLTPLAILPFFAAQSAADVIDDIYLSASYSSVSYDISDAERKSIQDDFSDIGSASVIDGDSGFQLKVGYQFNDFLAFEAGYMNLSAFGFDVDVDTTFFFEGLNYDLTGRQYAEFDVTGLTASAVANYQLSENLMGYARLGVFNWEAKGDGGITVNVSGNGISESDFEEVELDDLSGTDLFGGIGLAYDFDIIEVYGEYEIFTLSDDDDQEQDVSSFNLGAVYRF